MSAPRGLVNSSNLCYVNAVVQCLAACKRVAHFCKTAPLAGPVSRMLNVLVQAVCVEGQPTAGGIHLHRVVANGNSFFDNADHHDAQEFLATLLDLIDGEHDDNPKVEHEDQDLASFLTRYLRKSSALRWDMSMVHRRVVECSECGHTSRSFEANPITMLNVDGRDCMSEALQHMCASQFLDGSNAIECDGCKQRVKARLSARPVFLPKIWCIHLNRTCYRDGRAVKLGHLVRYPPDKLRVDKATFQLRAVCCHIGSVHGGHYYAVVRGQQGGWYECDDNRVVSVSADRVVCSEATMLFYEQNV